ncbi:MAG: alpha/beta fold hydrolase [Bryobacteraceae bacterium]
MSLRQSMLPAVLLTAVLFTAMIAVATAATPPGIPNGWAEGYVYANGIRIHYYHATPAPGKPVIVMAHGATDIGLSWTTLTKELQADYDIYMPDARGHGLTDPATAADTGDTGVEDLVGFIHAMKLERPILMGHSMGAATVIRLAAKYTDLPRAAIMLDPGLGAPAGRGAGAGAANAAGTAGRGQGGAPAPGAAGRGAFPPLAMGGTPEALVTQNNRPFDDLVAQCRQQTPKWDPLDCAYWALSKKQYHGSYLPGGGRGAGGGMNTADALSKITVPALILKQDAPPETRRANEEAAKVLKNGKLVHIDGAGHNLHHDQRQRTLDVLRPFLASV